MGCCYLRPCESACNSFLTKIKQNIFCKGGPQYVFIRSVYTQIANFMGPTWGLPGSCRPQMGPMLAPWTLLSGSGTCVLMVQCLCPVMSLEVYIDCASYWRGLSPCGHGNGSYLYAMRVTASGYLIVSFGISTSHLPAWRCRITSTIFSESNAPFPSMQYYIDSLIFSTESRFSSHPTIWVILDPAEL